MCASIADNVSGPLPIRRRIDLLATCSPSPSRSTPSKGSVSGAGLLLVAELAGFDLPSHRV
jgi:hypothetical protein